MTGAGVTGGTIGARVGFGVGAGVTGAGVTGAGVTGAAVTGAGVTGAGVTGAAVTGAGVTGAAVTGAGVTGAAVTGAAVTGAPLMAAHPQPMIRPGMAGQVSGSIKPPVPARAKAEQVAGLCPGISTTKSGLVISSPSPQTLHGGKPGLGGIGPRAGGNVTGAGVSGATSQPHSPTKPGMIGQKPGSMNPKAPANSKAPQVLSGWPVMLTITSGRVIRIEGSVGSQTLHGG